MSSMDDRQKLFEEKFAHDEELQFKATARRNKLLGLWAAEAMHKDASEHAAYAKEVVIADFEEVGEEDVVRKVLADMQAAGLSTSADDIRREMGRLMSVAQQQIMEEV